MNKLNTYSGKSLWLAVIMLTTFVAGCDNSNGLGGSSNSDPAALSVIATNPAAFTTDVAINQKIIVTFTPLFLLF